MFAYSRLLFTLSLGLCAAAACLPGAARAADSSELIATVNADDLDLTTSAGVAMLRHRVALAARNVCAWADPVKRMEYDAFADCVLAAARKAEPQTLAMVAQAGKPAELAATTAHQ